MVSEYKLIHLAEQKSQFVVPIVVDFVQQRIRCPHRLLIGKLNAKEALIKSGAYIAQSDFSSDYTMRTTQGCRLARTNCAR